MQAHCIMISLADMFRAFAFPNSPVAYDSQLNRVVFVRFDFLQCGRPST